MNLFNIPTVEHPYMPEDEMWLLPADLSERFALWRILDVHQRARLMSDFQKAIRDNRAAIFKVDTLEDR